MRLPPEQLDKVRKTFNRSGDGLPLQDFVALMHKYMNGDDLTEKQKLRQTIDLIELFRTIDVNGDGDMTWEEFTSFCIETGLNQGKGAKGGVRDVFEEVVREPEKMKYRKVRFLKQVPKMESVMLANVDSNTLEIYNYDYELVSKIRVGSGGKKKCAILSAVYISGLHVIAICSSDLMVTFWSAKDGKQLGRMRGREVRLMHFAEKENRLLTAGNTPSISIWKVKVKQKSDGGSVKYVCTCALVGKLEGHSQRIRCFENIPKWDLVATGSMDSTLLLWDVERARLRGKIKGHTHGVRFLKYLEAMDVLMSAGFENEVFCWDVKTRSLLLKLVGHRAPMCGIDVVCINGQHAVLTASSDGEFKTWKILRATPAAAVCLQSFERTHSTRNILKFEPHHIASMVSRGLLMVSGSTGMAFFKLTNKGEVKEENIPSCIIFNKLYHVIYVVRESILQMWDAGEGTLKDEWHHVSTSPITALCLDDRRRKLFIGNSSGEIRALNAMNGAIMKSYKSESEKGKPGVGGLLSPTESRVRDLRQTPSIKSIIYCVEDRCIIATVSDYSILILDDEDTEEDAEVGEILVKLRTVRNAHPKDVSCMAYDYRLGLWATGSADFTLRIWDFQFAQLEGVGKGGHTAEITALAFLQNYALLVSADCSGVIMVRKVRPAVPPMEIVGMASNACKPLPDPNEAATKDAEGKLFLTCSNDDDDDNEEHIVGIAAMTLVTGNLIATGDMEGNLRLWSVSDILESAGMLPLSNSDSVPLRPTYNPRRRLDRDYGRLNMAMMTTSKKSKQTKRTSRASPKHLSPKVGGFRRKTSDSPKHGPRRTSGGGRARPKRRDSVGFHRNTSMRKLHRIRNSSLVDLAKARPATPEIVRKTRGRLPALQSMSTVKAHDEGIVALEYIENPPTIVTASLDGRIKMWYVVQPKNKNGSPTLEFAGIMHDGKPEKEGDDAEWAFSSEVPAQIMNDTLDLAKKILRDMDDVKPITPATPAIFSDARIEDSLKPTEIKRRKEQKSLKISKSESLPSLGRPLANATPNLDAELNSKHRALGGAPIADIVVDTTPSVFLRRALEMRSGTAGNMTIRPSKRQQPSRKYVRSPQSASAKREKRLQSCMHHTVSLPALVTSPIVVDTVAAADVPSSHEISPKRSRRRRSSIAVVQPAPHVLTDSTPVDAIAAVRKNRTNILQMADDFTDKIEAMYNASPRMSMTRSFQGVRAIQMQLNSRYFAESSLRITPSFYKKRRASAMMLGDVSKREVVKWKQIFDEMPQKYGRVKLIELVECMKLNNWVSKYPWENVSGMFEIIESDIHHTVNLEEFLRLLFGNSSSPQIHELVVYVNSLDNKNADTEIKREELTEEKRAELEALFYEVDKDGSGTIDIGELYELLNSRSYDPNRWWEDESDLTFTRKELEELCALYDMDNNSELDMEEFILMMQDVW